MKSKIPSKIVIVFSDNIALYSKPSPFFKSVYRLEDALFIAKTRVFLSILSSKLFSLSDNFNSVITGSIIYEKFVKKFVKSMVKLAAISFAAASKLANSNKLPNS